MKKNINKNYILIGLIALTFITGYMSVSALNTSKYKNQTYTEDKINYNESNCNVSSHYANGNHTHDISKCTDSSHSHYGNTTSQVHYSESNCNVSSHYVNGSHIHDISNCTNSSHNHNNNSSHHKNKCHH